MKDHPRRFLQAVESGMASQPAADGHCAEKPKAIISGQSQAEGMAKFACRVTYQDLTPAAERLKVSILDSLACALVAIGAPPTAACLAQAKEFGGLNGRCTLIGGGTANVVYATCTIRHSFATSISWTVSSPVPSSVIRPTTPERCLAPASTPDDQAESS